MHARRHYCTYFDSRYLTRGLALYNSLRKHAPRFVLHVLCLDEPTYDYLAGANLDGVRPIELSDFETWDPSLPAVKPSRSLVEYYFTCAPNLVLYVMDHLPNVSGVTYLDADLYFFEDPAPIYEEIGSGSVGIIGHRFPPPQTHLEVHGIYNVGFLFFRNDEPGRRCLEWWRERCLEWCYDKVEDGKFADQKYLDQWPTLFNGVVVVKNKGAGVAPWNQARHAITTSGRRLYVGGEPLIFYHFHALRLASWIISMHGLARYGGTMTTVLKSRIYVPYIRELRRLQRHVMVGARTEIRCSAPETITQVARSITYERIIILAGPLALETELARVMSPIAWLFRLVRNLISTWIPSTVTRKS